MTRRARTFAGGWVALLAWSSAACDDAPCKSGYARVADSCVRDRDTPTDPPDPGPDAPPDAGEDEAEVETTLVEDPPPLPECADSIVGTYAVRDTNFTQGAPFEVVEMLVTVNYNRVEIRERAGRLEFTAELCESVIIDSAGRPSSVPPENLPYVEPPPPAPVELDCENMSWKISPERITGGFTPGLPEGCRNGESTSKNWQGTCRCPPASRAEAVPLANDADDCRVQDTDADAFPGVTVVNRWGDLQAETYVAYDHEGFATGKLAADGHHRGAWHDRGSESTILGCAAVFVLGCPQPNLVPCTSDVNQMVFVPIDESTLCGGIRASRDTLFSAVPPTRVPELSECF